VGGFIANRAPILSHYAPVPRRFQPPMQRADSARPDPLVRVYRPDPTPAAAVEPPARAPDEVGGRADGTEPTRFGDWEKQGRCIDF
jgi:hypothetical protein